MTDLFNIYQVTPLDATAIASTANDIHSHTFEELIIGVHGAVEHFIDYRSARYEAPFVIFVTKGKVHRIQPVTVAGACDLRVIRFKSEFIPETTFHLYATYHDNANIAFQRSPCFQRLVTLYDLIQDEAAAERPDLSVVKSLLSALFIMIESERSKQHPEMDSLLSTQDITFRNFLAILEENFRRPEGVTYYAEKLFMSVRSLNLICQHIMQQSVSEIVETRKMIEAKNLLMSTDRPVADIGFELGYADKAHFSSVFKKKAGQTPTAFRAEMRRLFT
ncbi:helix-turn-helix domain-containing protein [Sphingobacterium suaedae]|uniref:Helix-turn-helix domain-containing protein n=1 Tax=Sphingobacterium suaedae TaxID=1686402 RepID=A0ABW5KEU5_9SPHI